MDYLILSATLIAIGIYGLLTKRHLLKVLISLELVAVAATMNFVLLSSPFNPLGESLLILAFSTDTCITAIILALMFTCSKKYRTCDLNEIAKFEQQETCIKDGGKEENTEAN